jgi:hypothetical protein
LRREPASIFVRLPQAASLTSTPTPKGIIAGCRADTLDQNVISVEKNGLRTVLSPNVANKDNR